MNCRCLYDVAPLISKLARRGLHLALDCIFKYLCWIDVAVYMLLCLTDLRPYLTRKVFLGLLKSQPCRWLFEDQDIDESHFRRVPLTRFWNSVSLAKRLYHFPNWPLSPGKLQVLEMWSSSKHSSNQEVCVLQAVFNPIHKLVALVHKNSDGGEYFSTHWYSEEAGTCGQFVEIAHLSHHLSLSWSQHGTYLLAKVQRWQQTTIYVYKVDSVEKRLVEIKGLNLRCPAYSISSQLWISDTEFLFPGFDELRRVTRPWIYKIEKYRGGSRLTIKQPLRKLRKEHPKLGRKITRGCLKVLGGGFSYQASVCEQKSSSSEGLAHLHSILHFRDGQNNCHLSLAIPGLLLDAEGLPSSRIAILYRESSAEKFLPSVPCVTPDLPISQPESPKASPKFAGAARQSKVTKRGPFFGVVNRFECVSDSSSSQDPDSDEEPNRDSNGASARRGDFVEKTSDCYQVGNRLYRDHFKLRRRKRSAVKRDSGKKRKVEVECSLTSEPQRRSRCKIFLAVFNLEHKFLEMNEALAGGKLRFQRPYPEQDYASAFSSFEELSCLSARQGNLLQVTENLLVIHLKNLQCLAGPDKSLTLHLSNLRAGCKTVMPSWKSLFMHPTKNLTIEIPWVTQPTFPIILGACTDLLVDEPCSVNIPLHSEADKKILLKDVTFVVADQDGNPVQKDELRSEPAYGKLIF